MITGAVLFFSALLLLKNNIHEDRKAGELSEMALSEILTVIEPRSTSEDEFTPLSPELPVVEKDGYGYVGYLEIPSLELILPVMSDWDYERLALAPCRHAGSSRTDDLVIAAHNYTSHFGRLKELQAGDSVIFTDMDGIVNTYAVDRLETLSPDATETVLNSGCDLVLYTCTVGGGARVAVFCERVS